jgi:hypothetical protein
MKDVIKLLILVQIRKGSVAKCRVPEWVAAEQREALGYSPTVQIRDVDVAFSWLITEMKSVGILVMRSGNHESGIESR